MRLLQRSFDVKTRFGGNFVQEIDGVSGGREDGRRVDWFYYVNGIESSEGAGERKLYPGDRVWWDHHDWETAMRVPAVVGAFPEPFRSGRTGKKLPIQLVCLGSEDRSCDEVETRLARRGRAQRRPLEPRVLAGRGAADPRRALVRRAQGHRARQLEEGPEVSGVFAKPNAAGSEIELMDPDGKAERTLGPASGLVAATGYQEDPPTWLITGTDDVGVAAAAAALTEDGLRFHFALAIDGGQGHPATARGHRERCAGDTPARRRGAAAARSHAHAARAWVGGCGAWRSARCRLVCEHPAMLRRGAGRRGARRARRPGLGRELRRTAALGRAVRARR